MVAALGKYIAKTGAKVHIVTPLYRCIKGHPKLHKNAQMLDVILGNSNHKAHLYEYDASQNLKIYFVDHIHFFDRLGIYGEHHKDYADNAERFLFLTKVLLQLTSILSRRPDIVHLHDWQFAMFPILLHQAVHEGAIAHPPKTLLTIHNLAYQGIFPASQFFLTNLDSGYFNPSCVEYYGKMNFLKTGIVFADFVSTVSPSYAAEILTSQWGCGLEGVLRARGQRLSGILNGVDYAEWNTHSNPHLRFSYSPENISGKGFEKKNLQSELDLPAENVPLFGMISRLVEQKGVAFLVEALWQSLNHPMQFVLLGSGETHLENALLKLEKHFPEKVRVRLGYDVGLSHRMEAACDFFLMPSRFEPCGLNQLYSLRYGTIPIVNAVGGLKDSVIDESENREKATGIKLTGFTSAAILEGIYRGMRMFGTPAILNAFRKRAMSANFSWEQTAQKYVKLYRTMMEH